MAIRTPLPPPLGRTLRTLARRSDRPLSTRALTPGRHDYPMASALRILFVEDDPDVRLVTHQVLQSFGHAVVSCGFPEQALLLFQDADPPIDLLVTDVEMPGLSGIVRAQELTRRRPGLPVLIISGAHLSPVDQNVIDVHRWTFFSKPVRLPALQAAITDAVQNGHPIEPRKPVAAAVFP